MKKSILVALSAIIAFTMCIGEANAFSFRKKSSSSTHSSSTHSTTKSSRYSTAKKYAGTAKSKISSAFKSVGSLACRGLCSETICGKVPLVGAFCAKSKRCGGAIKHPRCVAAAEKMTKAVKKAFNYSGAAYATKKIAEKSKSTKALTEKLMCKAFCNSKFCAIPHFGKQLGAMCAIVCDNKKIEGCLKKAGIPIVEESDDELLALLEEGEEEGGDESFE